MTQWLSTACEPMGCWFESQSGHMPGLRARSPVEGVREATTHWCFSPSLSLSLPLCLKIKNIFLIFFKKELHCVPSMVMKKWRMWAFDLHRYRYWVRKWICYINLLTLQYLKNSIWKINNISSWYKQAHTFTEKLLQWILLFCGRFGASKEKKMIYPIWLEVNFLKIFKFFFNYS